MFCLGLHLKVLAAIRGCSVIKNLVYISCDEAGLISNASALCRVSSKKLKGIPFKPVKAIAVDLFPHTDLVERVVLFERYTNPAFV